MYSAFDEKLERDVALKVLLEDGETASQRKRLLREARIAAKLQHPNIATVYEVEELEDKLYIVMELLEGKALRRLLSERKVAIEEAISIARDMARGLARAHAAGVVHRDIKPENVFITNLGGDATLAKLLDFGLARQHLVAPAGTVPANVPKEDVTSTNTTSRGEMWGTPGYVSPEQALGQKDIDARTDIFSLGVVFYEMLANIRPFRGDTAVATMLATTRNEPRPLSEIVPEIPPVIDEIVKRCLRKKKDERFLDGGELSAALETFARMSNNSLRLPSIGSSPSLPFISQSPSQVPPVPPSQRRISYPGAPPASGSGAAAVEGEAATTGSAALSMSTQQESLLAMQEHQRDRMKLFIALTIGAAVALLSGILLITMSLTSPSKKKVAGAGSAEPSASVAIEVPPTPVVAPPAPSEEPAAAEPTAPAPAAAEAEPEPPAPAAANHPVVAPAAPHPRPAPAPVPAPAPPGSAKKPKPADCAKSPFTIDSKGVRIPKLYCL